MLKVPKSFQDERNLKVTCEEGISVKSFWCSVLPRSGYPRRFIVAPIPYSVYKCLQIAPLIAHHEDGLEDGRGATRDLGTSVLSLKEGKMHGGRRRWGLYKAG